MAGSASAISSRTRSTNRSFIAVVSYVIGIYDYTMFAALTTHTRLTLHDAIRYK